MSTAGAEQLYHDLLAAWTRRDAAGMAALFSRDGSMVGFDGSQADGGPSAIEAHLAPIFQQHKTPAYIGKVREVRALGPATALVRAVAGMVPDSRHDVNPALNTVHALVAVEEGGVWRASLFQSTPARFDGRPEAVSALTGELRALLPEPASRADGGPAAVLSGVGNTARWIAASRALESELAVPLFVDPYAKELAGAEGFALQARLREAMGASGTGPDLYLSLRTKFLDDGIVDAVRRLSLRQVVVLAAGMDTRAYRIPWPEGLTLYEVDREEVFAHKEPVLGRVDVSPSCERRVVRADLALPWTGALLAAGFNPRKPAAFLVEGLLMYLQEGEAVALLETIASLSARGSWLAGDCVNPEVLTSPYLTRYMTALREAGSPWRFGIEDPEAFFKTHGWDATVVMPGDPDANHGRWTFPTIPRAVPGIPRTFLVKATKATS